MTHKIYKKIGKILLLIMFLILGSVGVMGAMSDDIVPYWKSDTNGSYPDATGNGYTGTINNAVYTSSGKINGAYDYDGNNDYINFSDWGHSGFDSGYTYSVWTKINNYSTTNQVIIGISYFSITLLESDHPTDANKFRISDYSGSVEPTIFSLSSISLDTWYHLVAVYDGTNLTFYLNDVYQGSSSLPSVADTSRGYNIGTYWNLNYWVNGTIDEIGIWNRTLTSDEITELYNSGDGLQYPFLPPTPSNLSININSPSNGTSIDSLIPYTLDIIFNATGNEDIIDCILSENGSQINSSQFNISASGENLTLSKTFTTETIWDNVEYEVFCNDSANNATETTTLNLSLKSIVHSDIYPPDNSQFDDGSLDFNVTINSSFDYDCSLYLNDTLNETKSYSAGNGQIASFSKNMEEGNYSFYFYCNNTDGAEENTTVRSVMIDSIIPVVTINSPFDGEEYHQNQTMYLNVSGEDINLRFMNITITNSTGSVLYNHSLTNISSSPYEYTESINMSSWNTGTFTLNVTFCDAPNGTLHNCNSETYSFTTSTDGTLVKFQEVGGGSFLSTFNLTVDGIVYSTIHSEVYLNISDGLYQGDFKATGYAEDTVTIDIESTTDLLIFDAYGIAEIYFWIYDEENSRVINETVNLEIWSETYSANYSFTGGGQNITMLVPNNYTFRTSATGYYEDIYFLDLVPASGALLRLYLTNSTSGSIIAVNLYDNYDTVISGAEIWVYRFFTECACYKPMEAKETNFEGEATFSMIENEEFYKFYVYVDGTLKSILGPTIITDTSITMRIDLYETIAQNFKSFLDINYNLSFNEATNNFKFEYLDQNNLVTEACLYVYEETVRATTLYNYSCSSAASGTILVNADNSTETTYRAIAYLTLDGEQEYVDSLYHKFYDTTDHFGKQGIFIVLLLTMVLVFVGYWNPSIAVLLVPMGLFFGYILGIVRLPLTAIIGVMAAAVVIVYAIHKKS